MYSRKFTGKKRVKKRVKGKKKYSRKAGVLNRPSNMSSLKVEKPIAFNSVVASPGVRTVKRHSRTDEQLIKAIQVLIVKIENERNEHEKRNLERKLESIAQLLAEYR